MRKWVLPAFVLLAFALRLPLVNSQAPARATQPIDLAALATHGIADLPDGFSEKVVATGITGATALAVAPDGRVFVCEQTGALRVVKDDKLLDKPFVNLVVDSSWERGLIGVTLDPDFPKKPYVYLVYVAPKPYPHHVVSRFTANGDVADPKSEVVLLEGDDQTKLGGGVPNGHQGGALHFGKDGTLFIGIGEQTAGLRQPRNSIPSRASVFADQSGSARSRRTTRFLHPATGKYRAIWKRWAWRNLRSLLCRASQARAGSSSTTLGRARWEEIDEGIAGANYGWPHAEGFGRKPQVPKIPMHAYDYMPWAARSPGAPRSTTLRSSSFPRNLLANFSSPTSWTTGCASSTRPD